MGKSGSIKSCKITQSSQKTGKMLIVRHSKETNIFLPEGIAHPSFVMIPLLEIEFGLTFRDF